MCIRDRNYFLSDDANELDKWKFPSGTINPDSHIVVFASDKDRTLWPGGDWVPAVNFGTSWHYNEGSDQIPDNWKSPDFDISDWLAGYTPIGFGDDDDMTIIDPVLSLYMRINFQVVDIENIIYGLLHMDYDDGFVAYLNGQEFARDNIIGSPPAFDQGTITWREASMINGGAPSLFWVDSTDTWLNEGQNVLALQVHNFNSSSSDLSCIPFFSIGRDVTSGNVADIAEEIDIPISMLHSNFKISSEGETILITSIDGTIIDSLNTCLLYTSPSPRDRTRSRMPSSA